jgi:hypothetical protein
LESFRKLGVIDMVRSEANLRWRFDSCPHNRYSYILAKKAGSLAGYSVISKQHQSSGITAGLIIDFLVKDDDVACFEALITRAMQEFARTSCPIAAIWAFTDSELQQTQTRKFHFMSSRVLDEKTRHEMIALCKRLEAVDDIADLYSLLKGPAKRPA